MSMDLTIYHILVVVLVSISFFIIGLILVDLVNYIAKRRRNKKKNEDK